MDKKEKEIQKILLQHEKDAFEELKYSYDQALKDIKGRVLNLQNRLNELNAMDVTGYDERSLEIWESMKQSKIYQINYQKALEEQVGACIEVLKKDTVTNIQTYLDSMYKDSYLGNLYTINAKGIPVTTPINPSLIVKSINKQIDGMKFSDRVNTNMNDFKKTIKHEISRGIANGSTYNEIAQQLSMRTKEDMYKSQRIVRTEGARISTEARLTSSRDAKEKGADLVKQWDSTLDGRTRHLHMLLDGQIAEIDEPFDAGGTPVMGPGMFGDPGEDCNCRCVVLSVPRWDVEDTVVKYDNEKEELIETKNYEDWKQGYYRRLANEELQENNKKEIVIDSAMEKFIERYTMGDFDTTCMYSQLKIEGYNEKEIYKILEEEETSKEKIEAIEKLIELIENQQATEIPLVRIETLGYDESYEDFVVGKTFKWGIRSTSKDVEFANNVLKGKDEGLYSGNYEDEPIEYRIIGKVKALDIEQYSSYPEQKECLVQGEFEIIDVKLETVKGENGKIIRKHVVTIKQVIK